VARSTSPLPPRSAVPDLPARLDDVATLAARADIFQMRITGLHGDVDARHAQLSECVVAAASVDRLDLTGASLVDVDVEEVRATELIARSARWRSVRITGGRIATLDLTDAELDAVELRNVRIDYVSLGGARVADLLVAGCAMRALDMPNAKVERVRFVGSRADVVDTRGLRARDLDLRGLDALHYLDPTTLRGATLTELQAVDLGPEFARALGIQLAD
jgi:uncharacterized protein YjbI with pentapeptide repeats